MTTTVVIMIIIGIIICIASFFVTEKFTKKEENLHNLMSVDDDYEFSDRELRIIRRKIEDVIANQAKDILYETNESLANMANEKTLALGDYAVTVCEQIEQNHKEVMFLYSMLDDKQKDIMKTVRIVNDANKEAKDTLEQAKRVEVESRNYNTYAGKQSALEQLTALSQKKVDMESELALQQSSPTEEMISDNQDISEINEKEELNMNVGNTLEDDADFTEEYQANAEENVSDDLDGMDDVFAELDHTDINFDDVLEEEFKENENSNDIILQMHRNGNSILDIAKQLGLGVGEVKLVIDLYQGE